jgi:hypothetical protein
LGLSRGPGRVLPRIPRPLKVIAAKQRAGRGGVNQGKDLCPALGGVIVSKRPRPLHSRTAA